jgi:hypothetical protein
MGMAVNCFTKVFVFPPPIILFSFPRDNISLTGRIEWASVTGAYY